MWATPARTRPAQDAAAEVDAKREEIEALQAAAAASAGSQGAATGRAEALQKALDAAKVWGGCRLPGRRELLACRRSAAQRST